MAGEIIDFEEDRYSWSERQRRRASRRPYYDWVMK
jgi:hypothetical protein